MLFPDYTEWVLKDFRQKMTDGALPVGITEPTPARLRDICLSVCHKRYDRKDEKALEDFFGEATDKKTRLLSIENCDIDKFKPLMNYLKKPTIRTEPKNIELLAWLIDYKGRPYEYDKPPVSIEYLPITTRIGPDYTRENATETQSTPPVSTGQDEAPAASKVASKQSTSTSKKIKIIVTITILSVGIGLYTLRRPSPKTYPPIPPGSQGCMFWAEDHYQPVPCNMKLGDTLIIALDSEKLVHFRKITRPDTISNNARGSVWYVRYRGNYEFYTSDGYHPIDPQLRLRPITPFIIARHVPHN